MKTTFLIAFLLVLAAPVWASGDAPTPPKNVWSFDGVRADWNKDEIYRGYTVATQVCTACHGFKYFSHRDLMRAGFTEAEVAALAKKAEKKLDEKLVSGMDAATAQESYGKVPPDLSLMNKARAGLADYVKALLLGYSENPTEIAHALPGGVPEGAYYNTYYPGHAIAMPNPLTGPDMVTYHDGTPATVKQMAHDVAVFMQFTAEPEKIERQRLGVFVLLYLAIFTLLAYFAKRAIWKDVKGH